MSRSGPVQVQCPGGPRPRRSRRRRRGLGRVRLAAALLVSALCGCGPDAALWVRVEAPLLIPAECDAVRLRVERVEDAGTAVAYERTHDVTSLARFPMTLMLGNEESANLEAELLVHAEALQAGDLAQPWARASGSVRLQRGETVELRLRLCDCGG